MNTYSKILIIGGTGTLGQPTTQLLIQSGYQVRVMTRKPDNLIHLQSLGVEVIKGDLIDLKSLASACTGIDVIILMAHSLLGTGKYSSQKVDLEGHKTLIDIAKSLGIKKLIYISVLGARADHEVDFWQIKFKVEQHIQQSGIPYTIIRAAAYMETHVHMLLGKGILKNGKAVILGKGESLINFISVANLAKLILIVLEDNETHNKIIEIGGPDNISKNEVAALYGTLINKPVKLTHLSSGFLNLMSKIIRPFHSGIARVLFLSAYFDNTDQSFDSSNIQQKYPLQLTSIKEFVKSKRPNTSTL